MTEPREQRSRSYRIQGLHCAEEVAVLKSALGPLVGGADQLSFDVLNGKLTLSDRVGISRQQLMSAVARTGMQAVPWQEGDARADSAGAAERRQRAVLTTISGSAIVAGSLWHAWLAGSLWAALSSHEAIAAKHVPLSVRALYAVAVLAGVWLVLPKAWLALRQFRPD